MEKLQNSFYLTHYILLLSTFWITQADIPYPPTIIKQPRSDYLPFQVAAGTDEKDKPFVLECEAKGELKVDYKWRKNGQPFHWQVYDNRISQQPGIGTLIIMQPSDVDEGYYQCFASNEHGTAVSNVVFVRKSELNSFPDERVEERVINEGDPLTLQCSPPSGFPQPEIFWIIQSDNGALRFINSSRITVDPEGRLHFSNVTVADSFDDVAYVCSASIVYRNEYKLGNIVKLEVISAGSLGVEAGYPPIEQYASPHNIVAMREDSLELYCIFGGTPLPEIQWKKQGKALPLGRIQYLNYGKTLKIRKVDFDDEGTYQCTASNGMGTGQTREMVVTVQAKPYWISEPSDQNAAVEEDVEFECKASGVPEPEVKWFVNGVPLNDAKPNPRRKILSPASIRIEKLERTDTAVYQCNVSNTHGYVFKNFYVNVLDVPNPPRMVGVECNSLTARVGWQPMGDNRAPILSYKIQYNTSFTPDSWKDAFSSVPASDFKFEVAMSPWVNYTFRVIARNKIGESLPSAHSEQCQTPPDVPFKNPDNVVGKGTTPTNLVISWTPMPPFEHNAPGFFYRVYYRLDRPDTIWMPPIDISDWTKSQYEVTNQETFKRYIIKVEAHNSIGQADVAAMEVIGYPDVPYPPAFIKQPPPDYLPFQVAVGTDEKEKPFLLECEAKGEPKVDYKWRKNGQPFHWQEYDNRISQQPGIGTLIITQPSDVDEGYYQCFASNEHGTAVSNVVFVRKSAKPYWISEPSDQNAAEDEDVEFECKASGVPEPEVKWFINGVPLNDAKPNPRRKILSPASIRIEKLERTDTAVYQCNVSNTHGYVFKNFYVNVLAIPPDILISPKPLYEIIDGRTIKLSCEVFGLPRPVVKWTRNKQELSGNRFTILDNGDLEIRNALFTDAGKYQCIAKNKFGDAKSSEDFGVLEVKEQTGIILKPEDYEVAAGQSATFRCEADADYTLNYTIEWMKEDEIIDFDQNPRMFKAMDNSLYISKTSELDSGKYTCVARTRLDNVTAEAMLIVQDVPNPPRMVGVECNSITARVHWRPMGDNRAPILSYKIQYNTSFTPDSWEDVFSSVPAFDFIFEVAMSPWVNYTFRVIARNKIGESLPSAHSEQCQTPPDVPYKNPDNVVGKGTTPTNLVISWTPMPPIEHNAPGFFYRVYYRLDRPDTIWMPPVDISDWTKSQYEVTNQETFKRYILKVEAHNSIGQANVAAIEVIGYSGEDDTESN